MVKSIVFTILDGENIGETTRTMLFYKLASRPRQKPAENSTLSAAQVRHLMDFLLKYGSFLDIFRLNLSESKHGWETHESVSQVSKKQAYGLLLFFF